MTDRQNAYGTNTEKGIRKWFVLLICVLLSVLSFVPAGTADGTENAAVVRVGYYENEVFQEGADPDSVKKGYAYEYYCKLSEYTGWKYEYVYGSYGELYQMLLDGQIDLLAGLAWREDRVGLIGYPDAAMGNETYSLVKHNTDTSVTVDPATLAGKKFGVLDSAMLNVLNEWLETKGISAQVIPYADYAELFSAFDSGAVDILAAEGDGAYGREHAEVLCSFGASDYYLCVSIHRPDLLSALNTAQAQLAVEEPNYITSLKTKYYSVSMTSRAFSAAELGWLSEHSALKIGYLNNYLPYSAADSSGEATGLIRDIVPQMLESMDIRNVSVSYAGYDNYDRMIGALSSGEIDIAFPVGGGLYYSEKNGIFQSSPVVSAATELVFRGDYSDETVLHFAVNENNSMQYYFVRTWYPDAEISFFPSIDDCLKAVSEGRAGCTTLNGLRANDILRNSRYSGLSLLQTPHDDDRCFGIRIGNEGLLKLVNRGINVLGSDYAQNLAFRYTNQLYSYSFAVLLNDHIVLFTGIVLAVAAVIILFLVRDRRRSKREILAKESARKELDRKTGLPCRKSCWTSRGAGTSRTK